MRDRVLADPLGGKRANDPPNSGIDGQGGKPGSEEQGGIYWGIIAGRTKTALGRRSSCKTNR